jgi:MFS family permease
MIVSVVVGLAFMPWIGKWCDRTSPQWTFPVVFFARSICLGSFYVIKDPGSWFAFLVAIMCVCSTGAETIAVDSLLLRNADREIRGTVYGMSIASGYAGQFVFALCGGFLYDKIGPVMPFMFVAGLDGLMALFSMCMVMCGYLKNDLKLRQEREILEKNSQSSNTK